MTIKSRRRGHIASRTKDLISKVYDNNSTKRGSIHDDQVEDERTDSTKDERFDVKYMTIKFNKKRKIHGNQVEEERTVSSRTKD
jgi:hypothetical protein